MKKWVTPDINAVEISKTEHNWTGIYRDGGYIGDGEISGHLSWCKPSCPGGNSSNPDPDPNTSDLS